jgi:D-alanyl-D-alanine carboxypeptidase
VSTTADLDRFLTALTSGKLLAPAEFAEMLSALPDTGGYGLGFYTKTTSCGVVVWGHDGGILGYNSDAMTSLDGRHRVEWAVTPYQPTPDTGDLLTKLVDTAVCG